MYGFTGSVVLNDTAAAAAQREFGVAVGLNASATARMVALYAPISSRDGNFNGTSRLWGDGVITCCAAWAAAGAANFSLYPVHRLLYNTTLAQFAPASGPAGRASHGTDVYFLYAPPAAFTPTQQAVQKDMYGLIANLAVTGDVNDGPGGSPPVIIPGGWPAFTPGSSSLLVVDEGRRYSAIAGWQEDFCGDWGSALSVTEIASFDKLAVDRT